MARRCCERRLTAYTTEGESLIWNGSPIAKRMKVVEVRSNRMPGGGLVITFSDVTPSFEGRPKLLERA